MIKIEDCKTELDAVIDWVQVTFKKIDYLEIMEHILQFDKALMTYEGRGRFRYAGKWVFGGIEILVPPSDYPDMGFHIYMTGSACRSFEIYLNAQKRTWFDFFNDCLSYGGKFTRLDIAIDDRKPYLNLNAVVKKMKKNECVSNFENWTVLDSGTTTGKKAGCTINFGSRQSLCFMVFYEKNYEQSQKTGLPPEAYGVWNRYEVRLRQEMATNCVKEMVKRQSLCFIGLEIINYYLRLVVENKTDKNRSRWNTWKPWAQLMDGIGQLKLSMRPAPRTLEQKMHWVKTYVAPTLKMIQIRDDNLGEEFLKHVIEDTPLKENQKKIVEDYLFSRNEMQEYQKLEGGTIC